MSGEKISAMTPAAALTGAELVPVVQSGGNVKTTTQDIANLAPAAPARANPTATAGPVAVNGSAATFMRSDAAPAVQKGSNAQFGVVEGDSTTITIVGGVVSSLVSAPAGANPTATAGPVAVNGSAATFMRSDAAPAVQKASNAQFGVVEGDSTTITIVGGVVSTINGVTAAANLAAGETVVGDGGALGVKTITGTPGQFLQHGSSGVAFASVSSIASAGVLDVSYFGDGSSGDLSISSGTTTLTGDTYYDNVTLSGTAVINTSGYKLLVSGTLDISNAQSGAIVLNGNAASLGTPGGNTFGSGTIGVGLAGGASGAGGTAGGTNGGSLTSVNLVGAGGATGGHGGSGSGGSGGAGGTTTVTNAPDIRRLQQELVAVSALAWLWVRAGQGGGGGGGGGGDGTAGGQGAAGGGGAGGIYIAARTIARGTNSNTGIIQAKGGSGANGAAAAAGNRGGGGGGAGGD